MDNINQVKSGVEEILKSASFYSQLKIIDEFSIYTDKTEQQLIVKGRVGFSKREEFTEVTIKLNEYLSMQYGIQDGMIRMQSLWQVTCGICEGDKFTSMDGTTLQGQKTKVEHKDGQILLVDVWATWCGYCHEPMQENVEIMARNPNFASQNVSIVGISCDEDFAKWKSFVATKKWNTIPQYNYKEAMSTVGVRGIPYIFIVNKDGIVVYQGHPGYCDVENSLKNLISGKSVVKRGGGNNEQEENDQNQFWNDIDIDTKKSFITECQKILQNNGLSEVKFHVSTIRTKNLATGKETLINVPILNGYVKQSQVDAVDIVFMEISSTYNFNGIRPNLRLKQ